MAEEDDTAVALGEGEPVEGAPLARVGARLMWGIEKSAIVEREGDTVIRTPDGPRELGTVLAEVEEPYFATQREFEDAVRGVIGTGPVPTAAESGDDTETDDDAETGDIDEAGETDDDAETSDTDEDGETDDDAETSDTDEDGETDDDVETGDTDESGEDEASDTNGDSGDNTDDTDETGQEQ